MGELGTLALVIPVIGPVLAGWLAARFKVLGQADAKALSSAYLYILLPALIIDQLSLETMSELLQWRFIAAVAGLMFLIYSLVLVVERGFRKHALAESSMAAFASAKFNAGVIGLPLLLMAVGRKAVAAVVITLILGYLTILPLTLVLLELAKDGATRNIGRAVGRAIKHVLVDPLILSTAAGLLLAGFHVKLPSAISEMLVTIGNAAIVVPLIAVGITFDNIRLDDDFGEVLWISGVRVVVSPLIAIGAARLLSLPPLYAIVLVIVFSLPTAKMVFALAEAHGVSAKPLATVVALTTVSTVVTFPLWLWVCASMWPHVVIAPGRY
jgi:malonate transporter and related proteins